MSAHKKTPSLGGQKGARKNGKQSEPRAGRAEKAARIRSDIRVYWRTHSDRQMAEMAGCTHRTIASHRQKMEEAGEILPRIDESIHSIQSCWQALVRSGLPVIRIGKGSFVFADDLLAAIRQQQEAGS